MIYLDPSQRDSLGGGQAEGLSPLYRCHAGSERPVVLSKVIVSSALGLNVFYLTLVEPGFKNITNLAFEITSSSKKHI